MLYIVSEANFACLRCTGRPVGEAVIDDDIFIHPLTGRQHNLLSDKRQLRTEASMECFLRPINKSMSPDSGSLFKGEGASTVRDHIRAFFADSRKAVETGFVEKRSKNLVAFLRRFEDEVDEIKKKGGMSEAEIFESELPRFSKALHEACAEVKQASLAEEGKKEEFRRRVARYARVSPDMAEWWLKKNEPSIYA